MPLTKEQIRDRVAQRLVREQQQALVFADVVAAFQAAGASQKAQLVAFLRRGDRRSVGDLVTFIVLDGLKAQATLEADTILVDDQMSLAEIERVWL